MCSCVIWLKWRIERRDLRFICKLPNFTFHQFIFRIMKTYSFENLDVWQCSRRLSDHVYNITRTFPQEEKFGLISQMRRASISVASNLSEGTSKSSGKEKARYTEIAFCSLMELLNQAIISADLEFLNMEHLVKTRTMIDEIAVKATRLKDSQLKQRAM